MEHQNDYLATEQDAALIPEREMGLLSEKKSQGATFTVTMSAGKVFALGLLIGLLLMALPVVYLSAKMLKTDSVSAIVPQGNNANDPVNAQPTQPSGAIPVVSKTDHLFGNKNAKVTLIEYSDLECPYCKRFHPTAKQVMAAYKDDINWVYRHFPLSFHVNAQKEAEAAECAAAQGGDKKFFEYIDKIYERTTSNGTGFALDALVPLAKELKLNEKKFKDCLDGGSMAKKVNEDFSGGQAGGIDGTPGNVLIAKNGQKALLPGAVSLDELKASIDKLLK